MGSFVKIKTLNNKCLMLSSYDQFFQTESVPGLWIDQTAIAPWDNRSV